MSNQTKNTALAGFMSANKPKLAKNGIGDLVPDDVKEACAVLKEAKYSQSQIGIFLRTQGYDMTRDQIQKMLSRYSA